MGNFYSHFHNQTLHSPFQAPVQAATGKLVAVHFKSRRVFRERTQGFGNSPSKDVQSTVSADDDDGIVRCVRKRSAESQTGVFSDLLGHLLSDTDK